MAFLKYSLVIGWPRTGIRRIDDEAIREMVALHRDIMNAARRDARRACPRDTNSMNRSIQILGRRGPVRSNFGRGLAIDRRLLVRRFYASFTENQGPNRNWFRTAMQPYEAATLAKSEYGRRYQAIIANLAILQAIEGISKAAAETARVLIRNPIRVKL